ncbi:peptide-methionine (S)-S-oxide reductase MsrA [Vreelandella utahensis]|uniref:peptide-methionine (S)-S-oxide reductase MsrA n=1 Tax=Vreelandella halophila TaxID=86177 RepID=UPI001FE83D1E|nr:peptide-methionine (S)-S-oxide reductase MsrA [Halomonas utahensis]
MRILIPLLFSLTVMAGHAQDQDGTRTAVFAGGCFWCMEPPYDKLDGVTDTTSGYAGGELQDPTYEEVSSGKTEHLEVVRVRYNPDEVTYERLLEVFWRNIDPLDDGGQFCDRGYQYTTAIFTQSGAQRETAEASKQALVESGRFEQEIVTPVRELEAFYPAEDYHQNYYDKNPVRYWYYRTSCGRDSRLEELWSEG